MTDVDRVRAQLVTACLSERIDVVLVALADTLTTVLQAHRLSDPEHALRIVARYTRAQFVLRAGEPDGDEAELEDLVPAPRPTGRCACGGVLVTRPGPFVSQACDRCRRVVVQARVSAG